MMNWLKNWLTNKYWTYLYNQEGNYGGLVALTTCLYDWWKFRPVIVECAYCKANIWNNGFPDAPIYCDQYCAYYGPGKSIVNDEIPF